MKMLDILFEKQFYEKFQSVDFECLDYYAIYVKDFFFLYKEEHLGHLCQAVELRGSKQCKVLEMLWKSSFVLYKTG